MSRGSRHRSGFTLLELLLATLALSVVLAALNSAFYAALRLRESEARRSDRERPRQQALELLRRDLAGTIFSERLSSRFLCEPEPGMGAAPSSRILFQTRTGTLERSEAWSDILQVEYYLAPPEDPGAPGMDLVRATLRDVYSEVPPLPEEERLAPGLAGLGFEFHDGQLWTGTWDSELQQERAIPRWVRIRMEFLPLPGEPEDRPRILTRLVPLRIDPLAEGAGEQEEEEAREGEEGSPGGGGGGGPGGGGNR